MARPNTPGAEAPPPAGRRSVGRSQWFCEEGKLLQDVCWRSGQTVGKHKAQCRFLRRQGDVVVSAQMPYAGDFRVKKSDGVNPRIAATVDVSSVSPCLVCGDSCVLTAIQIHQRLWKAAVSPGQADAGNTSVCWCPLGDEPPLAGVLVEDGLKDGHV